MRHFFAASRYLALTGVMVAEGKSRKPPRTGLCSRRCFHRSPGLRALLGVLLSADQGCRCDCRSRQVLTACQWPYPHGFLQLQRIGDPCFPRSSSRGMGRFIRQSIMIQPTWLSPFQARIKLPSGLNLAARTLAAFTPRFWLPRAAGEAVIRNCGMQPHKSPHHDTAFRYRPMRYPSSFHTFGSFPVFLIPCGMVHLPEHSSPETIGPPEYVFFTPVCCISAVFRHIRDFVADSVAFGAHFGTDFAVYLLQPFLSFFFTFLSCHGLYSFMYYYCNSSGRFAHSLRKAEKMGWQQASVPRRRRLLMSGCSNSLTEG